MLLRSAGDRSSVDAVACASLLLLLEGRRGLVEVDDTLQSISTLASAAADCSRFLTFTRPAGPAVGAGAVAPERSIAATLLLSSAGILVARFRVATFTFSISKRVSCHPRSDRERSVSRLSILDDSGAGDMLTIAGEAVPAGAAVEVLFCRLFEIVDAFCLEGARLLSILAGGVLFEVAQDFVGLVRDALFRSRRDQRDDAH